MIPKLLLMINGKALHFRIDLYTAQTISLVLFSNPMKSEDWASRFTWGVGQEAAGVELELLHEAHLAIVTETVQVPLPQNKDGGGGVGKGGHREIKGLFSQDKRPVRLEESTHAHTVNTLPTEAKGTMFNCGGTFMLLTKGLWSQCRSSLL